jgi:hypothetical protein
MANDLESGASQEVSALSLERLKALQTLEVGVEGDFSTAIQKIDQAFGVELAPRENFHITAISPPESKVLESLDGDQLARLQEINQALQNGEGVEIKGMGYIDGATAEGIRPADKEKKTCFLAFDIPALEEFRASVGLPPKDFHITLGFVGGDIHMKTLGQDEKGKAVLGPIPKKADPALGKYEPYLPQVKFGQLDGQEKQKKQAS